MRTLLAFAVSMLVVACGLFAAAAFVAIGSVPPAAAPIAVVPSAPAAIQIERTATVNFHPELETTIRELRVAQPKQNGQQQPAANAAPAALPKCERCSHVSDDVAAKPSSKAAAHPCSCSIPQGGPQPKRDRVIFNFNR